MPTIILRDSQGVHVGFLLVAGDESLMTGSSQRDVVLMRVPLLPVTSPLIEFIVNHRIVEFSAHVKANPAGVSLAFEVAPDLSVTAEFTSSGTGTWAVSSLDSGTCQVVARKVGCTSSFHH
jgi:hypothetical protein